MKFLMIILCFSTINSCVSKKPIVKQGDSTNGSYINDSTAACIQKLIGRFQKEEKQNPPRSIYSYEYNGSLVYYVPPICCDFFSDLYDSTCKLIAHPDGGFTGRGDGTAPDFEKLRKKEKLIWKDER